MQEFLNQQRDTAPQTPHPSRFGARRESFGSSQADFGGFELELCWINPSAEADPGGCSSHPVVPGGFSGCGKYSWGILQLQLVGAALWGQPRAAGGCWRENCGALIPSSVGNAGWDRHFSISPTFHPFPSQGQRGFVLCSLWGFVPCGVLGFSPAVSRVGLDSRDCCPFPLLHSTCTGMLGRTRARSGSVGTHPSEFDFGIARLWSSEPLQFPGLQQWVLAERGCARPGPGCRDVGTGMLVVQPVPAASQDVPSPPGREHWGFF